MKHLSDTSSLHMYFQNFLHIETSHLVCRFKYTGGIIGVLTLNGLNKQRNKKNNIALQFSQLLTSENYISPARKM